ncbi:hypothetical protein [Streptomyces chartreusis]
MPLVSVNGVELYYEVAGEGDPLVLVHGARSGGPGGDPRLRPRVRRGQLLRRVDRVGAGRHPELFRGILAHEPPLLGVVADDPGSGPLLVETGRRLASVVERLRAGEPLAGARQFVEEVAIGPGEWERMPDRVRETFRVNAPTFADEQGDPGWAELDLAGLSG